jgi:hypothetical protein
MVGGDEQINDKRSFGVGREVGVTNSGPSSRRCGARKFLLGVWRVAARITLMAHEPGSSAPEHRALSHSGQVWLHRGRAEYEGTIDIS